MNQSPDLLPGVVPDDQEDIMLQQITLISHLLEGEPRAIIHDYTVNGGAATSKCSLPGEVTVWKITLQKVEGRPAGLVGSMAGTTARLKGERAADTS